jgi:hypothetical protein
VLQLLLVFLLLAEPRPVKHNMTTIRQKYEIIKKRKGSLWITAVSRQYIQNTVNLGTGWKEMVSNAL